MRWPFDVIAMGRVGVDLYPEQPGVPLEDVASFAKFLGGSAANVAVAAARLGHRSAVVSRTGADPFGRYIRRALRELGVDDRWLREVAHLPTPVAFCEILPPDDFPLYFYRFPKAPDLEIAPEELDLEAIRAARVLWVTGTGLSRSPSREATIAALQARDRSGITVLDLDYRSMFWSSEATATRRIAAALPYVTVVVGTQEECRIAVGERDPRRVARALHARGVDLVVVKQGPAGVWGSRRSTGEEVLVPRVPVTVVNRLGAGDAFGGALVHRLIEGQDLQSALVLANAAGSYVAGRLACADEMPDLNQLMAYLGPPAPRPGATSRLTPT